MAMITLQFLKNYCDLYFATSSSGLPRTFFGSLVCPAKIKSEMILINRLRSDIVYYN